MMHQNIQLIKNFYDCLAKKDWQGMIACYHDDLTFYDPVFEDLDASKAKAMWEMLCMNAKDLDITVDNIHADEEYGGCNWTAIYTFSKTGRKVTNQIKTHMKFQENKIVGHSDDFNLWKWSRMALGTTGILFGWASIMQKEIRTNARYNLTVFMEKKSKSI